MCQNTEFYAKKEWLLLLLNLEMPAQIMQKVLNIYPFVLESYLKKLKTEGEFTGHVASAKKVKPISLKLLADLKISPEKFNLPVEFTIKLMSVLIDVIEEEEILKIMKCSLPAILSFQEIRYDKDVPDRYKRLIEDVYGDCLGIKERVSKNRDYSCFEWEKYLTGISSGEISLPTNFSWETRHFIHDILENIAEQSRKKTIPIITLHICELLNGAIDELTAEKKNFLTKYYGLENIDDSCDGISRLARSLKISQERVRQMKERCIRCLRETLKPYYSMGLNWEGLVDLKKRHEAEKAEIKNVGARRYVKVLIQQSEKLKSFCRSFSTETENFLLTRIVQLDCSTKVHSILKTYEITYVYELAGRTEEQAHRMRQNGRKSLKEMNDILATHNLTWEMKWTNAEIEYFESMRK